MMVTAVVEAGEETLAFQSIISRLQTKQGPGDGGAAENRTLIYNALSNWFKEYDAGRMTGSESLEMGPLVSQFSTDIMSDDTAMVQAALQAMGFCLYQANIVRALSTEESNLLVKALCNCVLKTDDKSLCTRALWCLAKQNLKPDVIKEEIHTILCSVEKALQTEGSAKSMTVQHESINVVIRLQEQLPDDMSAHAARWGKLILPHMVHSAPKIRERAIHATQIGLVAMVKCRTELVPTLIAELKSTIIPEMMKLFRARHELCVMKVWSFYVTILGKTLHKGGSLINNLLAVIEQGFKHPQQEVKKTAFNTWRTLVENFSLDLDVLSNAKRLKLLMQPFLATSVRFESVEHAKLDAWWRLVCSLGTRLPATFHVVCVPLLEVALGSAGSGRSGVVTPSKTGPSPVVQGFSTPQTRAALLPTASPITPRLNLSSLTGSAGQAAFPSVRQRGLRMLAAILGVKKQSKDSSGPVDSLPQPVLTSPSVFSKLASHLIPFVMDSLFLQNEATGDLPMQIFVSLVGHVRGVVEGTSKKDSVTVFTIFMDHLTVVINSGQLPPPTVLKLLDNVSQLPKKVLSSSSYHTGNAGIMHGTPALLLTSLLFNQTVVLQAPEERFFTILVRLVECGMSFAATVLGFTQSVMAVLDKSCDSVKDKEALWRMWSVLAEPLLQHVLQTNEVNQGDSLEHDFSAITACLLFPVQRILPNDLPQPTMKTLIKLWSELYEAFARSASLVTIVEGNQCCEDVCSKLLTSLADVDLDKWYFMDAIGQVCHVITQNLDLAEAATEVKTPNRRSKRSRPEGNLTSLVRLVSHVTRSCAEQCKEQMTKLSPALDQGDVSHWFTAVQSLIGAMSDLCRVGLPLACHSILSKLSQPLGSFIHYAASPKLAEKEYLTAIEDKVERLVIDLTTTLQTRSSSKFDSEFLEVTAAILEGAFTFRKHSLRNYTLVFWTSTFGKQDSLQYPETLTPCLAKLKEKSEIALPGWKETDVISETPISQESEASQSLMAPLAPPVVPDFGGPSPQKMHGSFLRRTADAKRLMVASSPVKGALASPGGRGKKKNTNNSSPAVGVRKPFASPAPVDVAKRRLNIDEDSKMEFVVISSSPSKKRVLTEHQKEVLRTKRVSLALYNDLEQSQDMQAFATQTQSQSLTPSPIPVEGEGSKFSFSEKLNKINSSQGAKQSINEAQDEKKEQENEQAIEEEDTQTEKNEVDQEKENVSIEVAAGKGKKRRRVATFFQPVNKASSPIKDSGQLSMEEDEGCHGDSGEVGGQEESHANKEFGDGSLNENSTVSESSVVLIEDSCADDPAEEPVMASPLIVPDETKDEEVIASEICVPDTQEEPREPCEVQNESVEVQDLVSESPVKVEDSGESISESPAGVKNPDLEDVLPDGRFKEVLSTPVIKLQKLSARDIELYSPRKFLQDSEEIVEADHEEKLMDNLEDSKLEGSPEAVISPSQSSPSGTPRFRRYRSDEIHVRSATPKRTRRWNSVTEITKSESKIPPQKSSPQSAAARNGAEQSSLQSSQRDLAELAERYELDGIAPLEDLDQSIEEVQVNPDETNIDNVDKEDISDPEFIPLLKQSDELNKSDENRNDFSILSDKDIFSQRESESQVVEEVCVESASQNAPEPESSSTLSQKETKRKRRRPRRNQQVHVAEDSQDKSQTKDVKIEESVAKEMDEVPSKRKRGRRRKNEVSSDKDAVSLKQDLTESDKGVDKSCETSQIQEDSDVTQIKDKLESSQESMCMDTSDKVSLSKDVSEQTEGVVPVDDRMLDGNSSSEDLFGTCPMTSSSQVPDTHVEGGTVEEQSKCEDSFFSEDDDIPLGQLKKSLEANSKEEDGTEGSETFLPVQDSEDSEIDFPSLKPSSVRVSPDIDTPPRERLPTVKGSPNRGDSSIETNDEEILTITRSGRKCKPSAKIRCAKDILRRALKSPEGKPRTHRSKEGDKISPKLTRSSALKKAKKTKKGTELEKSDKEQTNDIPQPIVEEIHEVLTVKSSKDDLSSYAISPQSLQVLAEKVAKEVSPQSLPRVRSAHKSLRVSPDASPVSSQALHGCRSGRVSKRSKSPVSLRLKARRLCITPGPLQTRAGTKLSRVEIKKKNKRRRQSNVKREEEEKEEQVDIHTEEVQELESAKATDVIVISDTMSQEETQVSQESQLQNECEEVLQEASASAREDEEKESMNEAKEVENESMKESTESEDVREEPSQHFDEDGDAEMKEVEDMPPEIEYFGTSNTNDDNKENLPQVVEKETELEVPENPNNADDSDDTAVKSSSLDSEEHVVFYTEEVVHESPVAEDDTSTKNKEGIVEVVETAKTEDSDVRIRTKRSSQRLEFGDDNSNAADENRDAADKKSVNFEGCMKLQKTNDEERTEVEGKDEGSDSDSDSSATESDESDEQGLEDEPPKLEEEKADVALEKEMESEEAAVVVDSTPVGIVSSGLDTQDLEEDIINSSQSPAKFEAQTDSQSQRLTFSNLSPADVENFTSPDKPKTAAAVAVESRSPQVSPIIPNKFRMTVQGSPEGACTGPIWPNQVQSPEGSIPSMYSPNASPSSGILKTRGGSSSPSPSSKSRRVSFADKVFIEPEPLKDCPPASSSPGKKVPDSSHVTRTHLPPSPLVTTSASKIVARNSKYITTPSKGSPDPLSSSSSSSHRHRRKSPISSRRMKSKTAKSSFVKSSYASKVFSLANHSQDTLKPTPPQGTPGTQGTLTQGSPSTQGEGSLDGAVGGSQGAVYPALAECSLPVDSVLPRLTSSMWSRGLGQLVRARNIRTVGDLSALSPMQVMSLPIKSPKVSHLKKVLLSFQTEKFPDMKPPCSSPSTNASSINGESSTSPDKPPPQRSSRNTKTRDPAKDGLSPPSSPPRNAPSDSLVGRLESLVEDFRASRLESLPALELFQAHGHVNNLTESIMAALKMKCHSPSMGHDEH